MCASASMTMQGLDASSVTADDIAAIKAGLAAIADRVEAEDISQVSVTDATTGARRRALLGTAATVSFEITVSLSVSGYADVDELVSGVGAALSEAEVDR